MKKLKERIIDALTLAIPWLTWGIFVASLVSLLLMLIIHMTRNTDESDTDIYQSQIDELKIEIARLQSDNENLNLAYERLRTQLKDVDNAITSHEEYMDILANEIQLVEVKQDYAVIPGILTRSGGVAWFEGHKETWYNLPMDNVVATARIRIAGYLDAEEWVREDGCKMLGDYIMLAADQSVHPYGSIVLTSLGEGIVVDTGSFIFNNAQQIDIATNW